MKSCTPPDSWLGIKRVYGNGTRLVIEPNYNSRDPQSNVSLYFSPSYAMGCCGAATISNLFGVVQPKDRENLAYSIYRMMGGVTYYGIASSSQLGEAKKENSLLGLLLELGLKEVYNSPNHNHGPNNMHLMVWDPVDSQTAFDKYVWFDSSYGAYLPLSMKNLSKEECNKLFKEWGQIQGKENIAADKKAEAEKKQKQWDQITGVDSLMRTRHLLQATNQTYLQDTLKRHGYVQSSVSSNGSSRPTTDSIGQAKSFSPFAEYPKVQPGHLGKY